RRPLVTAPNPGTAEPPSLTASALAMWRGGHCLFESLDFVAGPGHMVLVVGPNGAGKTTLLRVAAGLTPPTSGRIAWGGRTFALCRPRSGAPSPTEVTRRV